MGDALKACERGTPSAVGVMRKGETLVGDVLSRFLCNGNRIPQSKSEGNKKRRLRRRTIRDM